MRSDSIEVRTLLSALIPKIEHCHQNFRVQELSNALYGLQGQSISCMYVCMYICIYICVCIYN
jgi:hypothetical protein